MPNRPRSSNAYIGIPLEDQLNQQLPSFLYLSDIIVLLIFVFNLDEFGSDFEIVIHGSFILFSNSQIFLIKEFFTCVAITSKKIKI